MDRALLSSLRRSGEGIRQIRARTEAVGKDRHPLLERRSRSRLRQGNQGGFGRSRRRDDRERVVTRAQRAHHRGADGRTEGFRRRRPGADHPVQVRGAGDTQGRGPGLAATLHHRGKCELDRHDARPSGSGKLDGNRHRALGAQRHGSRRGRYSGGRRTTSSLPRSICRTSRSRTPRRCLATTTHT